MANFFDQFDAPAAPAATAGKTDAPTKITVRPGDDKPKMGAGEAAARGAVAGASLNFDDELAGLYKASGIPDYLAKLPPTARRAIEAMPLAKLLPSLVGAGRIGLEALTGEGEATQNYETGRDEVRAANKKAEEDQFGANLAGQIVGGAVLPVGAGAQAATLPARMGSGALAGSGVGAVTGLGSGESAMDRATQAGTGLVLGGALGAAVPAAGRLAQAGVDVAKRGLRPLTTAVRGATDAGTDREAAARILAAREKDIASGRNTGLTQQQADQAWLDGQPTVNADLGGAETMSLARSAANTSSEARAALEAVTGDRFASQKPRVAQFIKEHFDFPEVGPKLEQLEEAARSANKPAYLKAYRDPKAQGIEIPEAFYGSPTVQQAVRLAFVTARDRGALDGFPPMRNPFVLNKETGGLELKAGPNGERLLPNLQFWDHVKRNLDKMGAEGQAFSKALRAHLDEVVPAYKDARAGAAKFFGAEDALEAGANFARMGGLDSIALARARQALANMKPAERKLFETGFVSNLLAKVEALKDNQDIVKQIYNSDFVRKQIELAVGKDKASMLEAHLITERVMDRLRGALGNSNTARYLYEMGMAGAKSPVSIAGLATAGTAFSSGSLGPGDALAGTLAFFARRGQLKIDEKVAARVGEMLASPDPAMLNKGLRIVSNNSVLKRALLAFEGPSTRAGAQQTPALGAVQGPVQAAAENEQPQAPRGLDQ